MDRLSMQGAEVMSLTDHNSIGGLDRCRARAEKRGMRFITGCEIDAFWNGQEYHFLAFGFDQHTESLRKLLLKQYEQYLINCERILPSFKCKFGITQDRLESEIFDYYKTNPNPVLNKWFLRKFLAKNIFKNDEELAKAAVSALVSESERELKRSWDWSDFKEVSETVHASGGILLLAHVASYARGDFNAQSDLIKSLMSHGLDGFELYHPANISEDHFSELAILAKELDCAISLGSDLHAVSEEQIFRYSEPDIIKECIKTIDRSLSKIRKL